MNMTWPEAILILIVLFASISAVGALRRIRDASEKTVGLLEELTHARDQSDESR